MCIEKKFSAILDDANANGIPGRDLKTLVQGVWFSPAVRVLLSHRIQRRLKEKGGAWRTALARMLWMRSLNKWGCDIGNQAEIAPGVYMPHTVGIVIGNFVKIEKGCTIYQHVTLGANKESDLGRPVIRRGAAIYAGASVLGGVEVGQNAVIGAHALVLDNVPSGAVVRGIKSVAGKAS